MVETIQVEVVYALPASQEVVGLNLAAGSTAGQAIEASALSSARPRAPLKSTGP